MGDRFTSFPQSPARHPQQTLIRTNNFPLRTLTLYARVYSRRHESFAVSLLRSVSDSLLAMALVAIPAVRPLDGAPRGMRRKLQCVAPHGAARHAHDELRLRQSQRRPTANLHNPHIRKPHLGLLSRMDVHGRAHAAAPNHFGRRRRTSNPAPCRDQRRPHPNPLTAIQIL